MKKLLFLICFFSLTAPAIAAKTDKHLLNEMLTTVNNDYLYDVNNAELVADGLNALHDVDKKFVASKGTDRIYVYYDGTITAILPFPQDDRDINAWVNGIDSVLQTAGKVSEEVVLRDYEMPDLMMKRMLDRLDKFSHYYSQFEYKEEGYNNKFHTLFADRMINDVLYLRIRVFNKQTTKQIARAISENPKAKGVILDLRGNSGGMLNEALQTANLFTDEEIITYTSARGGSRVRYYTSESGVLCDKPMVVIVDGDTASAAEVLAAGLQDQSRAKVIGTRTFGKGTIQNITEMSNGGKLVLTTEQFFTPSGKVIHEVGVMPDICTVLGRDDKCAKESRLDEEEEIDKAVKLIRNEL